MRSTLLRGNILGLALLLLLFVMAPSVKAGPMQVFDVSGTNGAGNPVDAEADFTASASGVLTVTLKNLQAGIGADNQLVSGVIFQLSGGSAVSATFTSSAKNGDILSNGSYTPAAAASPLPHWAISPLSGSINLDTVPGTGGGVINQIIGPDSGGKTDGSGLYSTNPSIANHNPNVFGSATFTLQIASGTTDGSVVVSNVSIEFGTSPSDTGQTIPSVVPNTTPEPASIVMLGMGVLGMAGYGWRRRKVASLS